MLNSNGFFNCTKEYDNKMSVKLLLVESFRKNVNPDPIINEGQDEERALAGDGVDPPDPQYCGWERGWGCQR